MKMPELTGVELARIVVKLGFSMERQHGDHAVFKHGDGRTVVIPLHHKPLGKGLLDRIVKHELGMEKEEFERMVEEHLL